MNKPSQGQVLSAIAILMNNADWDAVNDTVLQKMIDSPREAGRQFTVFLKNGGRVIVDEPKGITIDRTTQLDFPALLPVEFDPAQFIGKGWKWEKKDEDPRSLALTAIDFSKAVFTTCLKEGETSITGKEKLKRLIASNNIRLDPRFGVALFQEEGHKTLERFYAKHEISYLDFFGRILVDPHGDCCVLCLYRDGGRWYWNVLWLDFDWDGRYFSAVLAS